MEIVFDRRGVEKMYESMENAELNQSVVRGSEFNMSEGSGTAHDMGKTITDAANRASDYTEEKAGIIGDKLKDLKDKDFREIADEAKDYARRKPGQAILISAAAGLVLGFLLRNGRRVF